MENDATQHEISAQHEDTTVDYVRMAESELEFVTDDIRYITDRAQQQLQGVLHADYEGRVFGSTNTQHDTVAVQDGAITVSREVRDEQGRIVRSTSFMLANEISVWSGDAWEAIHPEGSVESYQQFAYISKVVSEIAARMCRVE